MLPSKNDLGEVIPSPSFYFLSLQNKGSEPTPIIILSLVYSIHSLIAYKTSPMLHPYLYRYHLHSDFGTLDQGGNSVLLQLNVNLPCDLFWPIK